MCRRYWCVSVGLYTDQQILYLDKLDLVSRNTCCLVEILAVNFRVEVVGLLEESCQCLAAVRPLHVNIVNEP